jgi:hypothetical protein
VSDHVTLAEDQDGRAVVLFRARLDRLALLGLALVCGFLGAAFGAELRTIWRPDDGLSAALGAATISPSTPWSVVTTNAGPDVIYLDGSDGSGRVLLSPDAAWPSIAGVDSARVMGWQE